MRLRVSPWIPGVLLKCNFTKERKAKLLQELSWPVPILSSRSHGCVFLCLYSNARMPYISNSLHIFFFSREREYSLFYLETQSIGS